MDMRESKLPYHRHQIVITTQRCFSLSNHMYTTATNTAKGAQHTRTPEQSRITPP